MDALSDRVRQERLLLLNVRRLERRREEEPALCMSIGASSLVALTLRPVPVRDIEERGRERGCGGRYMARTDLILS